MVALFNIYAYANPMPIVGIQAAGLSGGVRYFCGGMTRDECNNEYKNPSYDKGTCM
jgi:hypothetical protein